MKTTPASKIIRTGWRACALSVLLALAAGVHANSTTDASRASINASMAALTLAAARVLRLSNSRKPHTFRTKNTVRSPRVYAKLLFGRLRLEWNEVWGVNFAESSIVFETFLTRPS